MGEKNLKAGKYIAEQSEPPAPRGAESPPPPEKFGFCEFLAQSETSVGIKHVFCKRNYLQTTGSTSPHFLKWYFQLWENRKSGKTLIPDHFNLMMPKPIFYNIQEL